MGFCAFMENTEHPYVWLILTYSLLPACIYDDPYELYYPGFSALAIYTLIHQINT